LNKKAHTFPDLDQHIQMRKREEERTRSKSSISKANTQRTTTGQDHS